MNRDIYKLGLHQHMMLVVPVSDKRDLKFNVVRVHGGWLYNRVFVPYDTPSDLMGHEHMKDCYVIIRRNKGNSIFGVCELPEFNPEGENYYSTWSELQIIESINSKNKFLTYSESSKTYTPVYHFQGQIRTIPNEQKDDNIGNLPLIED